MSKLKKIVAILFVLVVLIPAAGFGYIYYKLGTMHEGGISTETDFKQVNGITNILLVGIDARDLNESGSRSDSMMILTIDKANNSLKLTSLARDSYVDIPGQGMQKLTHAYAYDGINTLLETVEQNFEIDIDGYAIVNFFTFIDIIDTLDGVDVTVDSGEIKELNKYIRESSKFDQNKDNDSIEYIDSEGTYTLKGYQALAYTRIRYNDSAFGRDERQREVIQSMMKKVSAAPITKYPDIMDSVLPYVKTSFSPSQMLNLGFTVYKIGFDIKQLQFPVLEHSTGGIVGNDGWVLQWDEDENLPILHDFIYEDKLN